MNYIIGNINIKLKATLSHSGDSFVWIISNLLRLFAEIFVLLVLFSFVPNMAGFTLSECLLIYSLYSISISFFYCFFSWIFLIYDHYIISRHKNKILNRKTLSGTLPKPTTDLSPLDRGVKKINQNDDN